MQVSPLTPSPFRYPARSKMRHWRKSIPQGPLSLPNKSKQSLNPMNHSSDIPPPRTFDFPKHQSYTIPRPGPRHPRTPPKKTELPNWPKGLPKCPTSPASHPHPPLPAIPDPYTVIPVPRHGLKVRLWRESRVSSLTPLPRRGAPSQQIKTIPQSHESQFRHLPLMLH